MARGPCLITFLVATLALTLTGCAGTRAAALGPLPGHASLLTLIVSEDRDVVRRECAPVAAAGPVLGCHISRSVGLADGRSVRAITIVRYTDALPSPMAFEIDAHELCHAIASLQPAIADPCHVGNDGRLSERTFRHDLRGR
ncbi:MAG: hypothetical protein ACREJG_03105 [Candidatus Rokuibacteriota bacterium]